MSVAALKIRKAFRNAGRKTSRQSNFAALNFGVQTIARVKT